MYGSDSPGKPKAKPKHKINQLLMELDDPSEDDHKMSDDDHVMSGRKTMLASPG